MRLSNAWQNVKIAGGIAFGAAMLLYGAGELYSAWTNGTVQAVARYVGRVTFHSNPVWFVSSVSFYTLVMTMMVALLAVALVDYRNGWRRRSRQDLDTAIRQSPEER